MNTLTLPAGTVLYHGTQAPDDFDIPQGPAWFSDSWEVARTFVDWHEAARRRRRGDPRDPVDRICTYEVVDDLLLLDGRGPLPDWWMDLIIAGDQREEVRQVCSRSHGWHVPDFYLSEVIQMPGSDTMICDPEEWLELIDVEYL